MNRMSGLFKIFKKNESPEGIRKHTLIPRLSKVDSNIYKDFICDEFTPKNECLENSSTKNVNYLKIDKKNNFSLQDEEEILNIKETYDKYKEYETTKFDNTNFIMNNILDKICDSTIDDDIFLISLNISKENLKNNKLSKIDIDNIINKLMGNSKINSYKSKSLLLNKENCEIIGSILSYSYLRLQQEYNIKDINKLLEIRKNILSKGIDVQRDFLNYCKENKNSEEKITFFWKKQRKKYDCLPEMIFLINRYSHVFEIEIDINLFDDSLDDDITKLIELTLLNIYLIFSSLKGVKINFINEDIQQSLYSLYSKKLKNLYSELNEDIKINNLMFKEDIFHRKWNFKDRFGLEENRNIKKKENLSNSINFNQTIDLPMFIENKKNLLSFHKVKRMSTVFFEDNLFNKNEFELIFNKEDKYKDNKSIKSNKNNKTKKDKNKNDIDDDFLFKFSNIFELILISLFCLSNSDKSINLQLIMNDSYSREFLFLLKTYYKIEEITENSEDFNILKLLIFNNIIKFINNFNIEINSLDTISFDKLLYFLYYTQSLTSFNISFFSSDITYSPQFLYRICDGLINYNTLKENDENSTYLFKDTIDLEEKILNNLSSYFISHLSVLFDIIKKMENLTELGLNFDIPYNIINKQSYMNGILKFLLNILYYFSNNEKIIKFCLLSPNTIFDSRSIPNIDNLLNNINFNKVSSLKNLSIQFQFYHIPCINNFINNKLQILHIGDLDMDTFRTLCNHILTIEFNKNSSLVKLSIGLVKTITEFDIELKFLLRRLFNIKIKNLISLGFYSNISITDELSYNFLLKILDNNWISEYTILFNRNSEPYISTFLEDIKNLRFFIPHNLEDKLLESEDIMKMQNNPLTLEIDKNKDYYDEAFWYFKFLFEKVYIDDFNTDQRIKDLIMGILKYLYFLKIPKINYPIIKIEN